MEKLKQKIEETGSHLYELYETEAELRKLQTIEKVSQAVSVSVAGLAVFIVCFFAFVFGSVAAAFAISEWAGHSWAGFLALAGFYLLIGIVLMAKRQSWIQAPLTNSIIRNFFDHDETD